jgi:hypothetical protein
MNPWKSHRMIKAKGVGLEKRALYRKVEKTKFAQSVHKATYVLAVYGRV